MCRARADRPVGSPRSAPRSAGTRCRHPRRAGALVESLARGRRLGDRGRPDGRRLPAGLRGPDANLAERPGTLRRRGRVALPADRAAALALGDGTLGGAAASGTRSIGSVQTVGLEGGAWCADGRSADLPLDQRGEDARSLTYTRSRSPSRSRSWASPRPGSSSQSDRPLALVSARLCEVQPDGASLLVTRGQLNLCHRRSHAEPELAGAGRGGRRDRAAWTRSATASRRGAGSGSRSRPATGRSPGRHPSRSRSRCAMAVLPRSCCPSARRGPRTTRLRPLDEPEQPEPPPTELLHGGSGGFRRIERDLASGATQLIFDWDCGGRVRFRNGIEYEDTSGATYSIAEGDPLSARVRHRGRLGHRSGHPHGRRNRRRPGQPDLGRGQ